MNDTAWRFNKGPTAVICMTATGTTIIMTRELKQIICDGNGSKMGQGKEEKQKWKQWDICLSNIRFPEKILSTICSLYLVLNYHSIVDMVQNYSKSHDHIFLLFPKIYTIITRN